MSYGIFAGFDYGRVWLDGEASNKWHQSVGGGIWLNGLGTLTTRLILKVQMMKGVSLWFRVFF
jgi:hypothetical protein